VILKSSGFLLVLKDNDLLINQQMQGSLHITSIFEQSIVPTVIIQKTCIGLKEKNRIAFLSKTAG
jgi:hypothetical protein